MKLAGGCLLVFLLSLFSAAVPATAQITANCSNGCYGPALASDELANTTVGQYGNPGNVVSYRFRAHHTGSVQSLHVYLVGSNHPGYGAGTGGTIQVTFQTDDGTSAHNPSGKVLSTYVLTNPLNALPSKDFPTFTSIHLPIWWQVSCITSFSKISTPVPPSITSRLMPWQYKFPARQHSPPSATSMLLNCSAAVDRLGRCAKVICQFIS